MRAFHNNARHSGAARPSRASSAAGQWRCGKHGRQHFSGEHFSAEPSSGSVQSGRQYRRRGRCSTGGTAYCGSCSPTCSKCSGSAASRQLVHGATAARRRCCSAVAAISSTSTARRRLRPVQHLRRRSRSAGCGILPSVWAPAVGNLCKGGQRRCVECMRKRPRASWRGAAPPTPLGALSAAAARWHSSSSSRHRRR